MINAVPPNEAFSGSNAGRPGYFDSFTAILKEELVPALGCTEPIAVAFAAATAKKALGMMPEKMRVLASGNVIKNVKGVVVPTTGNLRGLSAAALAGAVGGDAELGLEVLSTVTPAHMVRVRELLSAGICTESLLETPAKLHIVVEMQAGADSASVELVHKHTNIVRIEKNGHMLFTADFDVNADEQTGAPRHELCFETILNYAENVGLAEIEPTIRRQIECNTAISRKGLDEPYGAEVGRTLLECSDGLAQRARAAAAAASDARMSGCELPVVTNSGSGNQGVTVSLPVIEYARELNVSDERLIRALIVSNLVAIYQKTRIGRLSAFCGAVSAASGAGAGIAWLKNCGESVIMNTVTNTIANTGGIVCDGAKPSCAAKIASALESALLSLEMAMRGRAFQDGEGLVKRSADATVDAVTKMARVGMKETDDCILTIMLEA